MVLFGSRGPIAQGSCLINGKSGLPFALLKLLSCCSVLWILGVSWSAQHPIVLVVATPAPVVWRSAPLVPDSYPTEQRNSRSPLSHVNPRLPVSHGLLRQFQCLWQELLLCVLMSHAGEWDEAGRRAIQFTAYVLPSLLNTQNLCFTTLDCHYLSFN